MKKRINGQRKSVLKKPSFAFLLFLICLIVILVIFIIVGIKLGEKAGTSGYGAYISGVSEVIL